MISYSHRIFMYGPVALLALLAVGYSIYWQTSAKTLGAELDAINGREVMPGITFAFAEKDVGGFPFRLDAVLSGVTFLHKSEVGETAWRAEKIALHMLSYGRNHFLFEAAGLQTLDWPGADGKLNIWYVTPGTARASAILQDGKLARFDLDLMETDAKDADPKAVADHTISAGRAQLHLRANEDNTLDVAVKIEDARIGQGFLPAFGPDLQLLAFKGKISQGETLDALRAGADSFTNAAETWRKANGAFDAGEMTMKWDDAEADGQAQVSLDNAHRPTGSAAGFITGGKLFGAMETIRILAGTIADAQDRIPVALTAQNGELKLGKTLLSTLAPVY